MTLYCMVYAKIAERKISMEKIVCTICGYVYDAEENNGVKFEDLDDTYTCPLCGVGKDLFEER